MNPFSIWIGLGASLGLLGVVWQTPAYYSRQPGLDARLNAGLICLLGALIGARLFFAAENWPNLAGWLVETLQFWKGGLSGSGALLGGGLALGLYALAKRMPLGELADSLLPLGAALAVVAPLACWASGSAYGPPSTAFWAVPAVDEWGAVVRRFPLQPLAALASLLGFTSLERLNKHLKHPGMAGAVAWLVLSTGLLGISLLRADPAPLWSGQRMDTWAAGAGILIGFIYLGIINLTTEAQRH